MWLSSYGNNPRIFAFYSTPNTTHPVHFISICTFAHNYILTSQWPITYLGCIHRKLPVEQTMCIQCDWHQCEAWRLQRVRNTAMTLHSRCHIRAAKQTGVALQTMAHFSIYKVILFSFIDLIHFCRFSVFFHYLCSFILDVIVRFPDATFIVLDSITWHLR